MFTLSSSSILKHTGLSRLGSSTWPTNQSLKARTVELGKHNERDVTKNLAKKKGDGFKKKNSSY